MKRTLAALWLLSATGCAVTATQVKTLTIRPQSAPVVVTAQCSGTSTDYFLVHTAQAKLDLISSETPPATQPQAAAQKAPPAPRGAVSAP